MTEKFSRKDWLNYLNNLNNREISKRNSSGFTTWALFGLIGFTLFKLLDGLPIIFINIENVFLSKLFITNIFNLFMVIIVFMTALSIPRSAKRKIYTEFIKKVASLITKILSFALIVGFFCNIYTIIDLKFYGLSILPYCVFAIFEIIFIISYLIFRNTAKKENKMPRIDSGYYYNTKRKNPLKHIFVFSYLFLLFSFLFSIYQVIQNDYILEHLSVLKSVIYLSVFIGAIFLFIGNCISQMRNRWLEDFERKIMLQNLDEKEIVKAFIDEFVGKDVVQWLKEIEDETKEEEVRFKKLYDRFENEYSSLKLKKKDSDKEIIMKEKISKNLKEIVEHIKICSKNFNNNSEKLEYFLQQGPINDEEYILVKSIFDSRIKYMKKVTSMNSELETKLKELE